MGLWSAWRDYFNRSNRQATPVDSPTALATFLDTRASYVAQTSLYGYLRTRAGMTYPTLFDDDAFARSINIAKWHVWLDCLSDLTIYAGGLLAQRTPAGTTAVGAVMRDCVAAILERTGIPAEADEHFVSHAAQVRRRVADCDWLRVTDDASPFSESPTGLVHYAPVIENLKELDEEIVRNSVRFRWQEIRRDLRRLLDADAVLRATRTT